MSKRLAYIYVILGAACWGLIGVFNRLLGEVGVSVWNRVTIRNFVSLVLLTVVFALFRRSVFRIKLRHLPIFIGAGLLSVLGLALTYFNCQMHCSLAVAGILLYLAPSFVVLMSALFWKAPITKRKVVALVLSFFGCVLVSGIMSGALTVSVTGLLLGIGAGFCYATYTIFAHYGLEHYDSLTMIYWTFFFAGLGSLAFLNWGELVPSLHLGTTWIGIAGLVVIATVLPYLFYTKGLEGVESGKASIIANVEPVVAALTGVVFFHETLNVWTVLGIVCVLGGVVLLAKEE
ncbi:MAG: DMT family transporter [Oscillospiraceae bacterium]|nr:DMT family transporter [Oscillospiraceae bacterium]